jgi:magnesium transporter
MVEEDVLAMEHRLRDAFLNRDDVTRLFRLRREAIRLQHVLTRMSDVCGKLMNLDVPCIGSDVKPYFRDIHDQIARVDTRISGLIDVIRAVFEASNLLEQQRQGITTRQLAAWAAILGVPAAIAEILLNMPGVHDNYRYPLVLAVISVICVGLHARFKKLNWL